MEQENQEGKQRRNSKDKRIIITGRKKPWRNHRYRNTSERPTRGNSQKEPSDPPTKGLEACQLPVHHHADDKEGSQRSRDLIINCWHF